MHCPEMKLAYHNSSMCAHAARANIRAANKEVLYHSRTSMVDASAPQALLTCHRAQHDARSVLIKELKTCLQVSFLILKGKIMPCVVHKST
jgi:hypothetical protein